MARTRSQTARSSSEPGTSSAPPKGERSPAAWRRSAVAAASACHRAAAEPPRGAGAVTPARAGRTARTPRSVAVISNSPNLVRTYSVATVVISPVFMPASCE